MFDLNKILNSFVGTINLDKTRLRAFIPNIDQATFDQLYEALCVLLPKYNVNTIRRIRYFLAQTHFETMGFTKMSENLYYSRPERIVQVWPRRFLLVNKPGYLNANNYARNPVALANAVYNGRGGNLPNTNDGFNYRGRGPMHLTFKDNYKRCSLDLYGDTRLVDNPDLVSNDIYVGLETALWFWAKHNLNSLVDQDQYTQVTKVINGSTVTVPERIKTLRLTRNLFE